MPRITVDPSRQLVAEIFEESGDAYGDIDGVWAYARDYLTALYGYPLEYFLVDQFDDEIDDQVHMLAVVNIDDPDEAAAFAAKFDGEPIIVTRTASA